MIKIYLINLKRSPERLEFMTKQLQAIGLNFQRVNGVDGIALDKAALVKYQQQSKNSYLHYTQLNAGEIGCALSWHKVWNKLTSQAEKACIAIEDDVKLHDNFKNTIEKLSQSLDENMIIDLSGKKGSLIKETKIINGIKLIRYQTPPLKTQGKIYGIKACQLFLDKIQHFKAPVDTLQQMLWLHDVQIWSLETACLSHQDSKVGGSTIGVQKKALWVKLKKDMTRPLWRGFIVVRNFFTL